MKTLKGILFVGLITAFSSYTFAQGPSPTKFGTDTKHNEYRMPDNGTSETAKRISNSPDHVGQTDDPFNSRFNYKDGWIDHVRELVFLGLF